MLIWKSEGNVQDLDKYSGITCLSRVVNVLERILDWRIRKCDDGDRRRETGV